jgi:hypothetical protein
LAVPPERFSSARSAARSAATALCPRRLPRRSGRHPPGAELPNKALIKREDIMSALRAGERAGRQPIAANWQRAVAPVGGAHAGRLAYSLIDQCQFRPRRFPGRARRRELPLLTFRRAGALSKPAVRLPRWWGYCVSVFFRTQSDVAPRTFQMFSSCWAFGLFSPVPSVWSRRDN